jgi:deoxyadenosine/deoxycytidine kinase
VAAGLFPYEVDLLLEPVFEEPGHSAPSDVFLRFEQAIIEARATAAAASKSETIVSERSLSEDCAVFVPLHLGLEHLEVFQVNLLRTRCNELIRQTPPVSSVLYLTASSDVLRRRLERDGSVPWLVSSLSEQVELYEVWYAKLRVPKLRIDTSRIQPNQVAAQLVDFASRGA